MRALRLTSVGGIQKPSRVLRRRSLLSPMRLAAAAVLPVVAVDPRVSVSARRLHRRRRGLLRVCPRRRRVATRGYGSRRNRRVFFVLLPVRRARLSFLLFSPPSYFGSRQTCLPIAS